ncbi:MAG: hypothetical protein OXF44_02580 [Anaerolineaceae bacterium]|nr:hypothetical protein [Anaerolineaceae bacterium]
MALIEERDGREKGGGYHRLFGDDDLGFLISKVHGAVNSAGRELEKIIKREVTSIDDLEGFLEQEIMPEGVFIVGKKELKASTTLDFSGSEPDFVVFRRRDGRQQCHVIELKDGDNFDTKKSSSEQRSVHDYVTQNAPHLQFTVTSHICSFNQEDKEAIVKGFKGKIEINEAMTGRELCELLEIDYDAIVEERKKDQRPNFEYFVRELTKIEEVKDYFLYCLANPEAEQQSLFKQQD